MALVDNAIEQIGSFRAKHRLRGAPGPAPTVERAPWPLKPIPVEDAMSSPAEFLEEMDTYAREAARRETMEAVVQLKSSEVRALVRQVAKSKGRYLAAFVEFANHGPANDAVVGELQRLRLRYEELSAGMAQLREMIFEGQVQIDARGSSERHQMR